jgi:hypothetical protein
MRTVRYALLLSLAVWVVSPAGAEDLVERESGAALEVETAPPTRDPAFAWASLKSALPAGHEVRRIAFAMHGVNVLHGAADDARTFVTFFQWMDGRYSALDTENFEGIPCTAPGVDPAHVTSALDRLLAGKQWQEWWRSLDSLILECNADTVYWWLFPVPEGGYQEGVTFATVKVPFKP